MKKISLAILFGLLFFTFTSYGQQIPIFNNYLYNPVLNNPARTGKGESANLFLNFRKQWANIPNSPDTKVLTFDMPVRDNRIGVGSSFYVDNTYVIKKTGGSANYAYHIPLEEGNKRHSLSMGTSIGMVNQRINFSELPAAADNDNSLFDDNASRSTFDMTFGVNYQLNGLDVDVALPQLISKNLRYKENDDQTTDYEVANHYLASVSYKVPLGTSKKVVMNPVALLRGVRGIPVRIDLNLVGSWNDKVWAGMGVRSGSDRAINAIIASAGFKIKNSIKVYYNFEYATDIGSSAGPTHGLAVGYSFGNDAKKLKKKVEEMEKEWLERRKVVQDSLRLLGLESGALKNDMSESEAEADKAMNDILDLIQSYERDLGATEIQGRENQQAIEHLSFLLRNDQHTFSKSKMKFSRMGSIFFAQGSYQLTNDGRVALRGVKGKLDEQEFILKIYVTGHASKEGSETNNLVLSNHRIAAVKNYLVTLGVDESKIFIIPYGEQNPLDAKSEGMTEEELAKERRVDIHIISDSLK